MYKLIEAEVAGALGEKTELDNSEFPPLVKRLNYEFDGWLGDDILESFPCYIMTERLKKAIENEKLSGIIFDDVLISKSESFLDLYQDKELPTFFWAKINGKDYQDDFFITEQNGLAISDKAFLLLQKFNIDQVDFEDL